MNTSQACEQYDLLLSGYLDGELTQGDRQRVELHLEDCHQCRTALDQMSKLRANVGKLSFGELSPEELDVIMNDATVRTSRGFGWLLYIGGIAVIIGYGLFEFARDDEVPALIKTAVAATLVGFCLLLASVVRQRMITSKTDRYKDVQI